jgi:flagella basal body P-ring formation protein FlgA
MVIDVEVSEPGRAPWNYPIWFAVRAKAQVWVLEEPIAAGATLSAARKHWDWTELTEAGGVPAGQDFPFEDYMAKVPLDAGVTLTLQVVTRRPEVFAGQPVSLRYRSPRIEVAAPGIALQSGNTGDRVHVKNSGSGDETIGIVEGNGVVQVTPQ